METVFDWIAVMLFAGLVIHFLAESVKPEGDDINLWHYLLLSTGCALANWLGNHGYPLAAIAVFAMGGGYAFRFIGPARRPPQH